jgi:hypothetical protein
VLEVDTEREFDAIEMAKKNIEISKGIKEGVLDPRVYRGEKGYANYFELSEDDIKHKSYTGTLGP